MIIFEYCPILGLKHWRFIGVSSVRAAPEKTNHKFPSSIQNVKFSRIFKTQHKENGRISKPIRGEDE